MAVDDETFKRKIEELKEAGHEYRYRDQLMVQEFSLSMVATGVLLNALYQMQDLEKVVIQIFGFAFLLLLTLHLRNINQDRVAASKRKAALAEQLEFSSAHQNVSGRFRITAPRQMVRFTALATLAWLIWTMISIFQFLRPLLSILRFPS